MLYEFAVQTNNQIIFNNMHSTLTIVRYPKWRWAFGFLSMAAFHFFLLKNKAIRFYKLMGSGKNGTFDIRPDLRQWAILAVFDKELPNEISTKKLYGKRIAAWWKRCHCEVMTIAIEPIEGHGTWDGKECFGALPKTTSYEGAIAVLTRATIRLNKASAFWKNVKAASELVRKSPGFITSFGIGEAPWIKQATFSIWQNKKAMKEYAYKMKEHQQVIQKTRKENWYSEEMFVRFKVLWTSGTLEGKNVLKEQGW